MTEVLIGRRYAQALFAAARDLGQIDEVEGDFQGLKEVWEKNPDLARLLENPDVGLEEKRGFLDRILPEGMAELVRRFLEFLLEKKRVEYFVSAAETFHELVEEERNSCTAEVTGRAPLSEPQHRRLSEALSRLLGKGVSLVEKADPGVIGGLRVSIRDRVIDRTIRSGLVHLRESLLEARLLE